MTQPMRPLNWNRPEVPLDNYGAVEMADRQNDPLYEQYGGIAHTQGRLPHLMQLLQIEYRHYLEREIEQRQSQGRKTITIDEAMSVAPYTAFFNFCVRYLTKNRPVENFFVDMNHGVKLSNNVRAIICPGISVEGTMQESGAVAITQGLSQEHLEGVQRSREIPI